MRFSIICFVVLLFASSCNTQKRVINNYLENTRDTVIKDSIVAKMPVIQKGDLLSIKVYSKANGIQPALDAPYNLASQGAEGSTAGFLVDDNGNIEYPQLGLLHVEGLTREQLIEMMKQKLVTNLSEPSVIVRFLNYKLTILGEVNSPGTFTVPTERVTILEAIGLAGDITEFGQKSSVKIVREKDGQREIGTIDLTSKDMFTSPYFRLQQNDVVFVEQTKRKIKQQEQQTLLAQISIATTVVTAVALILNFIK